MIALNILNQTAAGKIDPPTGLETFFVNIIPVLDNLIKASVAENQIVFSIYREEFVETLTFFQEDRELFIDTLLNVRSNEDLSPEARQAVYALRYREINHVYTMQSRVMLTIRNYSDRIKQAMTLPDPTTKTTPSITYFEQAFRTSLLSTLSESGRKSIGKLMAFPQYGFYAMDLTKASKKGVLTKFNNTIQTIMRVQEPVLKELGKVLEQTLAVLRDNSLKERSAIFSHLRKVNHLSFQEVAERLTEIEPEMPSDGLDTLLERFENDLYPDDRASVLLSEALGVDCTVFKSQAFYI